MVRSDVSWKGGVSGLMTTAALCRAFGSSREVHMKTNALLDAANLHVCCAIKNCEYFEILIPQESFTFWVKNRSGSTPMEMYIYLNRPDSEGESIGISLKTIGMRQDKSWALHRMLIS
jgi:L-alanine-DL-glutamate epimerase-like enolase superfamily enzyme